MIVLSLLAHIALFCLFADRALMRVFWLRQSHKPIDLLFGSTNMLVANGTATSLPRVSHQSQWHQDDWVPFSKQPKRICFLRGVCVAVEVYVTECILLS